MDTKMKDGSFRVRFSANEFTSAEEASDLALLRCAEIAIENGYKYFALPDEPVGTGPANPEDSKVPGAAEHPNVYRNVAYGRFDLSGISGTTYYIEEPRREFRITLHNKPPDLPGPVFHALQLYRNINNKYNLNLPPPSNKAYKSLTTDQKSLLEKVKQR